MQLSQLIIFAFSIRSFRFILTSFRSVRDFSSRPFIRCISNVCMSRPKKPHRLCDFRCLYRLQRPYVIPSPMSVCHTVYSVLMSHRLQRPYVKPSTASVCHAQDSEEPAIRQPPARGILFPISFHSKSSRILFCLKTLARARGPPRWF